MHEYVWVCILEKAFVTIFWPCTPMYSTTLQYTPCRCQNFQTTFPTIKKSLNHALYRVFVGLKLSGGRCEFPNHIKISLFYKGFSTFHFFSTRFLHGFLNFRTFFPNSLLHIYPRVCYNYSLFYLSAYEKTIVSLLPRRLSYFHL